MPIEVHCPGCGQLLRAVDSAAGKRVRCPSCSTVVGVPVPGLTPLNDPQFGGGAQQPSPTYNPLMGSYAQQPGPAYNPLMGSHTQQPGSAYNPLTGPTGQWSQYQQAGNPSAPATARRRVRSHSDQSNLFDILFSFQGRVPRRVYWAAQIAIPPLGALLSLSILYLFEGMVEIAMVLLVILWVLGVWSLFAVTVKRWQDLGKSAVWMLIVLIPIVGAVLAFIDVGCTRGTYGPNKYGPDPT